MSPVTHFLAGWAVAHTTPLEKRDRALVTLAGVIPDLDGFGLIVDLATRHATDWWGRFHHELGHNMGFCLLVTLVFGAMARRHSATALLVFISFQLHLLGDLVGARGPEGEQWAIPILQPLASEPRLVWDGQWALNAWPNILITVVLLGLALRWACKRGHSPVEMISPRADAVLVRTLRRRFPGALPEGA